MPKITPKYWLILGLAAAIIIGGVFFVYNQKQKEPAQEDVPAKIGVININKAIEVHPKYPQWLELKKEEAVLLENFEKTRTQLLAQEEERFFAERESERKAFEDEFNAKMKAKQEELEKKVAEKSDVLSQPLNAEMDAYLKQVEEEYQPKMADLQLKLNMVQMEEAQFKETIAQIEALKKETNDKIDAKQAELSKKIEEQMAPDVKAVEEELNLYAGNLSKEISDKMAQSEQVKSLESIPMPPELKALEDEVVAKRQEVAALHDSIQQDVRFKIIDIAIKHSLDVVAGTAVLNNGALDITDSVIAELKIRS